MRARLRPIGQFIRLSRPHVLLAGALLYGLGASIAGFLDHRLSITTYLLGQALVTLLQLLVHYLMPYYESLNSPRNDDPEARQGWDALLGIGGLPPRVAFYSGIACLTLAASVVTYGLTSRALPTAAWLLLIVGFLAAFVYCVPPLRLGSSAYGEVLSSIATAGLIPSFACAVQTGELDRYLLMTTTPLVALHFAMLMSLELRSYASDLKWGRRILMTRLGWAMGMRLHDLAILLAVGSLVIGGFSGLPLRVVLGPLIVLPLALAQVWQLWRIRRGFPPRWGPLTIGAMALFMLTTYLMLAGFVLS